MKYVKHIGCVVALLVSLSGYSASVKINGVTWNYSIVSGGASITGASPASGSLTVPSKVNGYDVISISGGVFRDCSGLTGVTIPGSVKTIGTNAFRGSGLQNVTMENGVTSIGNSAFYGCSSLKTVSIPNSVTTIDNFAFYDCDSLKDIVLPDSVASIGPSSFADCGGLTSVIIGRGLTKIGSYAFRYCSQLVEFVFNGNSPGTIGDSVFTGVPSNCQVYVRYGSTGWGATIPGTWRGFAISWCQFVVTFDANGGICTPSVVPVERGTTIGSLPVPTRPVGESAAFLGWFTEADGGEEVMASIVINADITFYAHWSPVCRYNINGDGTAAFAGYSLSEGDFTIPSEIDGYPIVAIATNAFYGCNGLTSVTIPNTVTNIGSSAFSGCSGLTNVTIPDSVAYIGERAFYNCTNIASVALGSGVTSIGGYAFYNCSGLISLVIPDSVTNINGMAFYNCTNLASVVMGNSVASIGGYAFYNCRSLTSVIIPDSVISIGGWAFYSCINLTSVAIGDGMTAIGSYVFSRCSGLTSVTIPCGVTKIGEGAFSGCSGLANITIPDNVADIGSYAFENCSGLASVSVGACVTNIGYCAFSGCTGLTSFYVSDNNSYYKFESGLLLSKDGSALIAMPLDLTTVMIPDGVKCVGDYAFYNCRNLANVTIPNSVTSIGNYAFDGTPFYDNQGEGLVILGRVAYKVKGRCPAVVTIPDGVTSIAGLAFSFCYDLTNVTIPDSVTSIGYAAFDGCMALTSVTIGNGVTNIGNYAFHYTGLTSVTIPESVASIGNNAFWYCRDLTNVVFYGDAPQTGGNVFNTPTCVYVRGTSTGWGVSIPGIWKGVAIDYIRHSVFFDANGGTCEPTVLNIAYGLSVGASPTPTRENAEFIGWYTEFDGGERFDASLAITNQMTLYAHWLTEVARPVIVSDLGAVFRADSCEVSITSETEGATIYYTDDGTTPKRYDDYLYAGPVTITDTTTFKAVAVVGGLRSAYTTVTITKHNLTLDEALNVGESVALATNPALPWQPVYDAHAKLGDATARSCAIGNRTNTWLTATVSGAGTMSFWLKTSCEHDDEDLFTCDRLMVYTNGVEITDWRMDGETDWTQRTLTFNGGENTVKWVYYKDKSDTGGEDCAWVDGIEWVPSAEAMLAAWLAERGLTADARAANGRTAAECYALGLDPALATNDFRIVSIEMVDGKPKVEWEPKVNRWTGVELKAVLKGAESLDGPWEDVPEGSGSPGTALPTMRFFKVVVEVP